MLKAAWGLLRDTGQMLLEAAPEGIDLGQVRTHLLEAVRPARKPARGDS